MTILTASIFTELSKQAKAISQSAATTDGGVLAFSIVILAGFWAIMALMMAKQIPSIATSLVGGASLRAELPGHRALNNSLSKAAKPAAGAVSKGAGAVAGAAKTAVGNLGGRAAVAGAKATGSRAVATAKSLPAAAGAAVGGYRAGKK